MWIQNRNRTLDSDSATYESDSDSNLHDSDSKSDSTTHDSESGIKSGFGFRFVLWFRLRIRNRPRSDAYTFLTPSAKQQNVIWLGWVFQAWCPANMSYVGKLTTAFIAIGPGQGKVNIRSKIWNIVKWLPICLILRPTFQGVQDNKK